ncbi:hypothetical protein [Deinococcus sp. QL22]|uniref:DUF7669 domain-containing protein n=1 Tax=Deinococcus sp. QL22 TaxID=2939437 RepID=UPI00201717FE|nr:hypothetical protein [Deinococcus sp. QL22]UQN06313.1 hypothetical protein M1R55_15860 [Deinococcus sp. QL22]
MTCRNEILKTVNALVDDRTPKTFHIREVLASMVANHTQYSIPTIRTYISSLMCQNAPRQRHGQRYNDFERVGVGRYRLL